MISLLRALLAATLVALSLTACGSEDSTQPEPSSTEHNDADVAFATDMVQHHAQALAMVQLTVGRPLDPEVEQLAEDIRAAQTPEIETMVDWLGDWGEEVPETVNDHANAGHDMDDMGEMDDSHDMDMGEDMPGMMSAEDMAALADASDAEFQDMWLEMMVEHHEGAAEMAQVEQEEGRFRPALDLAASIEESQTAEIDTMQGLLAS